MKQVGIALRRWLLGCLLGLGTLTALAQEHAIDEGQAACQHTRLRTFGRLPGPNARVQYPGDPGIDVTYYKLDLTIRANPNGLRGIVTVGFRSTADNLSQFFLDLHDTLRVDSVRTMGSRPARLTFTRQNNRLIITLNEPLARNAATQVLVYYQGVPPNSTNSNASFVFGTHGPRREPVIWSLSEPYGARDWFPCKDTPCDKADSSDVWLTADRFFVSVSNGRLEGVTDNPDNTRTYRWRNRYPIAHYLISVAMSNYQLYQQTYRPSPRDTMPVTHYVYPEALTDRLRATLDETTRMLDVFSQYFGPYPFRAEKYGHAQFGWGGGMEHQTISSMGQFNTDLMAHELAHQWFGDAITTRTWEHIWLNEGFASYAEALYREATGGQAAYRAVMNANFTRARRARGTLLVQDITSPASIFDGDRTYAKGAVVLHMLRGVVGDPMFREILRGYASSRLLYGTAVTEDFQRVAEQVYGRPLGYFFRQWIYGENYPAYQVNWSSQEAGANRWTLRLRIQQSTGTSNPTFFTMPVPIRITTTAGDTTLSVFNNSADQTVEIAVRGRPTALALDPDNWILKQVEEAPVITGAEEPILSQLTVAPNPAVRDLTVRFRLRQPLTGQFRLTDVLGRTVLSSPDRPYAAGPHTVTWPVSHLATGRYILQFQTPLGRWSNAVLIER